MNSYCYGPGHFTAGSIRVRTVSCLRWSWAETIVWSPLFPRFPPRFIRGYAFVWTGFNCNEACNIAPPVWLDWGSKAVSTYKLKRHLCIPFHQLIHTAAANYLLSSDLGHDGNPHSGNTSISDCDTGTTEVSDQIVKKEFKERQLPRYTK